MRGHTRARAPFVVYAALLLAGCGSKWRPPIYQKAGFNMQWIDRITVLSAVDARIDPSIEVNLDEQLRDASVKILTGKGYQTVVSPVNDAKAMTIDDLKNADAVWIAHLGPADARWVLVVGLIDVTTSLTFGSTGNAEVAGFLYDKKDATLAWRDKGVAQVGQGGLLGIALIGAMDDAAISEALEHLLASFPQRTESDRYRPEPTAPASS